MQRILWALAVFVLLLAASAAAATPEDQIMQADRDFNKATQERRAEGWLSYISLDEAAIPDPPTAGKQAIIDRYQKQFANTDFKLTWDPIKAEVFPGGNVGYTTGKYVARFKSKDGKNMESTGRYITVWRKQEDGSWKIVTDTGGPDRPAHEVK
jgi:ketosteroid isomerase-like protein